MQTRNTLLAAIGLVACTLGSRQVGETRERWTIVEGTQAQAVVALAATPEDSIAALSRVFDGDALHTTANLARIADNGTTLWSQTISSVGSHGNFEPDTLMTVGDLLVAGGASFDGEAPTPTRRGGDAAAALVAYGLDGAPRWAIERPEALRITAAAPLPDGSFACGGFDADGQGWLGRLDAEGSLLADTMLSSAADGVLSIDALASSATGMLLVGVWDDGAQQARIVGLAPDLSERWRVDVELSVKDLAVDDDGELHALLGERISGVSPPRDNTLLRLTLDGEIADTIEDASPDIFGARLALAHDGTVVVAGQAGDAADTDVAFAEIDPATGISETTRIVHPGGSCTPSEEQATDVLVMPSGDIVVGGIFDQRCHGNWRGVIARYAGLDPDEI